MEFAEFMLVTVITTLPSCPSCEHIIRGSDGDFVGLGALGRPIPRSQGWMWAFWMLLFLLLGPNVHNSGVTCAVCSVLIWVTVWSLLLCLYCSGRMELCKEAKCLPEQNILQNDRNITLAGVLEIHTESFTSLPHADIN